MGPSNLGLSNSKNGLADSSLLVVGRSFKANMSDLAFSESLICVIN